MTRLHGLRRILVGKWGLMLVLGGFLSWKALRKKLVEHRGAIYVAVVLGAIVVLMLMLRLGGGGEEVDSWLDAPRPRAASVAVGEVITDDLYLLWEDENGEPGWFGFVELESDEVEWFVDREIRLMDGTVVEAWSVWTGLKPATELGSGIFARQELTRPLQVNRLLWERHCWRGFSELDIARFLAAYGDENYFGEAGICGVELVDGVQQERDERGFVLKDKLMFLPVVLSDAE